MFKVLKVLYARDTKVSLGYWIFCEIGIDNLINLRQFDFKKAEIVTCSRSLTCILSRANGQLNQSFRLEMGTCDKRSGISCRQRV